MKYSTVSQVTGVIVGWYYAGISTPYIQRPTLPITRGQKLTVEEEDPGIHFCALVQTCSGKDFLLQFTPDTPPILHRGKGGPPELCEKSQRVDGKLHSWEFDGDDPWVVCCWCGVRRRA